MNQLAAQIPLIDVKDDFDKIIGEEYVNLFLR
jgi:hypothetical protein